MPSVLNDSKLVNYVRDGYKSRKHSRNSDQSVDRVTTTLLVCLKRKEPYKTKSDVYDHLTKVKKDDGGLSIEQPVIIV